MPSGIVMEKGESLDVWARRGESGIDMPTGLQVLCTRLMHALQLMLCRDRTCPWLRSVVALNETCSAAAGGYLCMCICLI